MFWIIYNLDNILYILKKLNLLIKDVFENMEKLIIQDKYYHYINSFEISIFPSYILSSKNFIYFL